MSRLDAGAATVWVVLAAMLVAACGSAAVLATSVATVRSQAGVAADLAALAAAHRGRTDPATACARASEVAAAQRANLVRCELAPDGFAQVLVESPLRGLLTRWGPAVGRARAGPASLPGQSSSP